MEIRSEGSPGALQWKEPGTCTETTRWSIRWEENQECVLEAKEEVFLGVACHPRR